MLLHQLKRRSLSLGTPCTCYSLVICHMLMVTCSLLETSVVLSAITVMKRELWSSSAISHSIWRPITVRISFCMSGLVQTVSFVFNHSTRSRSSSAFIQTTCFRLPSDSSPSHLMASHCLLNNLIDDIILSKACQLLTFLVPCWCRTCSPIFFIVAGRVT